MSARYANFPVPASVRRFLLVWRHHTPSCSWILAGANVVRDGDDGSEALPRRSIRLGIAGRLVPAFASISVLGIGASLVAAISFQNAQSEFGHVATVQLQSFATAVLTREAFASAETWFWLLLAASLPFLFAVEDIFLFSRRPTDAEIVHSTGIMAAISCAITLLMALAGGAPVLIEGITAEPGLIVFLIAAFSALATVLAFYLATVAGAVFASQAAHDRRRIERRRGSVRGGVTLTQRIAGEKINRGRVLRPTWRTARRRDRHAPSQRVLARPVGLWI